MWQTRFLEADRTQLIKGQKGYNSIHSTQAWCPISVEDIQYVASTKWNTLLTQPSLVRTFSGCIPLGVHGLGSIWRQGMKLYISPFSEKSLSNVPSNLSGELGHSIRPHRNKINYMLYNSHYDKSKFNCKRMAFTIAKFTCSYCCIEQLVAKQACHVQPTAVTC